MRAFLLVLLCLSLAGSAAAEPIEVTFSTLPPDCTVINLADPEAPSGLGSVRAERPGLGGALRFRLVKPGYNSLDVTISEPDLPRSDQMVWPAEQGSFLRLEPLLVTATFLTTPGGAQIWTSRSGQSDDYLGLTGEPILLNLANLLGDSDDSYFRVRLVAAGYQSVDVPVPQHLFGSGRPNRWPAEGEYALAPTGGLLAPMVFYFRMKPWSGALVVLVLVSFAALLVRMAHKGWGLLLRARNIERRAAQPGADLSGSRLGPYRLFEVLGKGATATVFRGSREDESRPIDLAVKVFHLGEDSSQRLASEVRPLLELRHPNLVGLVDWGQAEGFAYLVTELVPGRSLRQELQHGPLRLEPWRALVDDLLRGMSHAHDRQVVHGDIKPENILLPYHGKTKLVDFGLARRSLRPGLNRFGGTPGYMAPELMAHHAVTPLTDQFAAGTVLYEALYGVFPGVPSWRPDNYAELEPAILKMREPDPAKRYADAEEARQALLGVRVQAKE